MELNFLCWLLALSKLNLLQEKDHLALVVRVFSTYLDDMRKLQSDYWLEPAGQSSFYISTAPAADMSANKVHTVFGGWTTMHVNTRPPLNIMQHY